VRDAAWMTVRGRRVLFLAVSCLGISAFMTQVTLMRELVSALAGNELVLGIVLGNWLLLTGFGSYVGKTAPRLRNPLAVLVAAQVAVAVLPVADVFVLRALRNVVFVRGAAVGITGTVFSCFVLLAPYCLVAGYLLTLASLILATKKEAASIGQVYFLDNVGDVVGGVLFSFILVWWWDHFQILYLPAFLNLLFACLVALLFKRKRLLATAAAVTAALAATTLLWDLDDVSAAMQYPAGRIVYKGNSPYGNLVVTESAGQYDFIHNGVFLFSTHDVERVEETVHYAMVQRPDAERVLLISGGVSGTAKEILKYKVHRVDYVELDPLIKRVAREYLPQSLADPRIEVIYTDGRRFVRRTKRSYDVVVVDVPDPCTSQINRFYTREFFGEVKARLRRGGVLCFSLKHYEHYLSPELADLIGVAVRTLKEEFTHVLMIPAGQVYFLASDGPLTSDIAARLEASGIRNQFVNRHYLKAQLAPDRMAALSRAESPTAPVNKDFSPILYYYDLLYWKSQFNVRFGFLEVGLLGILVLSLFRLRPVSFAIFTTGLAASSLEVVLLVGFQILYGYVYHQVGLIITMFMLGLGIGSWTMNRMLARCGRKHLVRLECGIALYAACLPAVLIALSRAGGSAVAQSASNLVIPLLALVLAVLVGLEFPLAGKADFHEIASTAAKLYTADYVGAALGALLVSTLLIPLMGVVSVCLLVAVLNLVSGAVVLLTAAR